MIFIVLACRSYRLYRSGDIDCVGNSSYGIRWILENRFVSRENVHNRSHNRTSEDRVDNFENGDTSKYG